MYHNYPICTYKADCRGCRDGLCTSLNNTDFKGKPCPFYKTKEQFEAEDAKALKRLKRLGRDDLIGRYRSHEQRKKKC